METVIPKLRNSRIPYPKPQLLMMGESLIFFTFSYSIKMLAITGGRGLMATPFLTHALMEYDDPTLPTNNWVLKSNLYFHKKLYTICMQKLVCLSITFTTE